MQIAATGRKRLKEEISSDWALASTKSGTGRTHTAEANCKVHCDAAYPRATLFSTSSSALKRVYSHRL